MPHVVTQPRRVCFALLLTLWPVGCRSSSQLQPLPRYVVTASPIDVSLGPSGVCVAVDPLDRRGVWWWEPGASGCASRSTGPGVFHADLKPNNVLYGKRGEVKIIDYGLAWIKGEPKDRVQGTPEYMAPETAKN